VLTIDSSSDELFIDILAIVIADVAVIIVIIVTSLVQLMTIRIDEVVFDLYCPWLHR